jgi:multisubunit Na+/H+ antiporter MnhE subunit
MGGLQEVLAGSRIRFAASLFVFLVLFLLWLYVSANWNPDVKLAGLFVHDLFLVGLLALRFRQLRMAEAWALLAFVPLVGLLVAVFLLVRSSPAPERYSAF